MTSTHYQRLGVAPSASTEEIRAAYRVLAGRLHPDRLVDASTGERALAERRMREINEAWTVLQDPGRRRRYDDSRIQGTRRATGPAPRSAPSRAPVPVDDGDLVDVLPDMTAVQAGLFRHLPWVALVGVFALIFVASAYATADDDDAPTPARPAAGSCVDVTSGPTTTIVPCSGPHELRIVERVAVAADCPAGTEGRRLSTDGRWDCVRRD